MPSGAKRQPLCHKRALEAIRGLAHQTGAKQSLCAPCRANQLLPLRLELNYAYRVTTDLIMKKDSVESILAQGKQRAEAMNLPYAGALLPLKRTH